MKYEANTGKTNKLGPQLPAPISGKVVRNGF